MKRLTLDEAKQQIKDRETWLWRQKNWSKSRYSHPDGAGIVGDHDEDYVFDALFDVPNR